MANNENATTNEMQLPKYFWAFSFELITCHLFQQKLMPVLHDNDAL